MVYALTRDVPKFLDAVSDLFEKHGMVLATNLPGQGAYAYAVLSHDTGRLMAWAHLKGRLEVSDQGRQIITPDGELPKPPGGA